MKTKSFVLSLLYTTIVLAIYTLPFISPFNINNGIGKLFDMTIILYLLYLGLVFITGYFICLKLLNTQTEELTVKKPLKIVGVLALIHIVLFSGLLLLSFLAGGEGPIYTFLFGGLFFSRLFVIFTVITFLSYSLIRISGYKKLVLLLAVALVATSSASFLIYRSNNYCYQGDYICNTKSLAKENKISSCESDESQDPDVCYHYFVKGGKDVSMCQELISQNAKSECVSVFARGLKSPQNCGLIDSSYIYRFGVSYQEMCCIGYYRPYDLTFDEWTSFGIAYDNQKKGINSLTPEQLTSCDISNKVNGD